MSHFWGDEEILTQPFSIKAIHQKTGKEMIVFKSLENDFFAPNNGANHYVPSMMMLPTSGLWKLEAYFGDDLFGTVFVNVK